MLYSFINMRGSYFLTAISTIILSVSLSAQNRQNVLDQIETLGNFAPMFPFQPTHDAPDNITNVRTWPGVDGCPAGSQGFIRSDRDKFVDEKGNEIRFLGTQCGMTGCFPEHEQADRLAREFTRYGINIVRMHYVSHRTPKNGYPVKDSFIEPEQLEKFDYFISRLKENGIYLYFQLNIARKFGRVNGLQNAHLLPKYKNGVDNVNEHMIELQKKFHKEILEHVNPYTGIAYKDEPCISMFELANENSIVNCWFSKTHKFPSLVEPYKGEIVDKWNDWLHKKYGKAKNIAKAWADGTVKSGTVIDWPDGGSAEEPAGKLADFIEFLAGIEQEYFAELYDNVKNNIGVCQPVAGTQLGYGFNQGQAGMDYCDIHTYWCHPAFPGGKWDNNHFNVRNEAIINSWGHPASAFTKVARSRIFGKPFTVSEFDIPNLNFYSAEADVMMAALGAFQDWSGLIQFSWILDKDYDRQHIWPQFDMCSAPQKLVHFPACYSMFVRGDVRKDNGKEVFVRQSLLEEDIRKVVAGATSEAHLKHDSQLLNALPLAVRTGVRMDEAPELFAERGEVIISSVSDIPENIKSSFKDKHIVSSTGELVWDWQEKGAGYFMVDTKHTKVFSGFVRGRSFTYKDMKLIPGKTRLDWMTLSMTLAEPYEKPASEDIMTPGRYLLAATGLTQNTDMKIVQVAENPSKISISEPDGGKLGTGPVLCEGIEAELVLQGLGERVRCHALDPDGNRMQEVEVGHDAEGNSIVKIGPEYRTIWYEIIIR